MQSPTDIPNIGIDVDATDIKEGIVGVPLSNKEHAQILRKIDWHVIPIVSSLYLFSFLDRTNIGNAKVAGMETDLNLVGLRYNTAAAIFFISYCLAQIPSNIILKLVRPSLWLPTIMVLWGLVMTLMCLVKTYHGLLVARFFLGLAEAGMFPGVTFYLTLWYPRAERARRMALFISGAGLAGAFSGLLAYFIEKLEGVGGLHGWQWIFCLEGIATMLLSLAAYFLMNDCPETASFLTEAERQYIVTLLRTDSLGLATHYHWQFVMQALKDYKIYLQFGVFLGLFVPGYAVALFTPTIIHNLGYSAANAQLLSVPPFAAACACTLLFGFYSDKYRLRGPYLIAGFFIALVGFILLYAETRPAPAYVGNVLAVMGVLSSIPIALAWVSSNAGGDIKRATAIAMMSSFGNLGGICASFIFFDPPRFHVGVGTVMGLICVAMLLTSIAMYDFTRLNKQKEMMCRELGITDDREEEFKEKGDDSPLFRYSI